MINVFYKLFNKSTFYQGAWQVYLDGGGSGLGSMYVGEDLENEAIDFIAYDPKGVYLELDARGKVDTLFYLTVLSGKAIVNKLLDQLNNIKVSAATVMEVQEYSVTWLENPVNFELPATGVSIDAIGSIIREIFKIQPTNITGEIVLLNEDSVMITIRVLGHQSQTTAGRIKDLDSLLFQLADFS